MSSEPLFSVLFIFLEGNKAKAFERCDQYCAENTGSRRDTSCFNECENCEKAYCAHDSANHLKSEYYLEHCLGFNRKEVGNEGVELSLSGVVDESLSYHIGIVLCISFLNSV